MRVIERTNFRLLGDDAFPGGFDLVTIDASFISLRTILARAVAYVRPRGAVVALVKPQFEAGRERVKGGVVRDRAVHRQVLEEVVEAARGLGLACVGLVASPLRGPAGNREFFLALQRQGDAIDGERIAAVAAEGEMP